MTLIKTADVTGEYFTDLGQEYCQTKYKKFVKFASSKAPLTKVIRLLNRLTDEALNDHLKKSVCTKGCSHCCHIPTLITLPEALYIQENTGVLLSTEKALTPGNHENFDKSVRTPCTFLKNNECSIYEFRPTVCRTFHSLDSVQHCIDFTEHNVLALAAPGEGGIELINRLYSSMVTITYGRDEKNALISDIRDFFPH